MASKNKFFVRDDYMVGVTKNGVEFFFDKEDAHFVCSHTWHLSEINGIRYVQTGIKKDGKSTTIKLHRLVLKVNGGMVIDHVNHDGLDNRKVNLRICSHRKNMWNRTKRVIGTSRFKGVYFSDKAKRWIAQIQVEGKKKYLGIFEREEDAAAAYNEAAVFYFGEYATLNKIA
ncbi:hypothetical protein BP422_12040 [Brevibacillus formosus]|uniref:AP2/ERF domain-containing protein n=1 Tax=Brevibacillus formosus TaxID=54913 RepID=A0A220MGY5_9BACL|nr:HNH endonuclease [Brevibacillus formosus]ASJ54213.1 hypothetical protein BP422_12040 [Brevibacillus formosus]